MHDKPQKWRVVYWRWAVIPEFFEISDRAWDRYIDVDELKSKSTGIGLRFNDIRLICTEV